MVTKVSKAEQEQIKKAHAQAMEDSARQFLDEKAILNMQAAGRLRQAFEQERAEYENRLNNERDQQYAAMQQEQANQQANYERQISDLQRKMNDRQARYDATVKALQDQLKGQTAAQNTAPQNTAATNPAVNQTASNPATQNTAQRNAQGEVDFTKAPQAQTAEDVNNQDAKTRVWQSLNNAYNSKIDESNRSYNKSISQLNNTMLSRGMPRSSYAAQLNANMYNDMIKAQNDMRKSLIAEYQDRIGQIEAQEKESEFRDKQFEEGVRQFNAGQELTRSENALNRAFSKEERESQQKYQSEEKALDRAFSKEEREAQQKYQAEQAANQQKFQAEQAALNREQDQAQFEVRQAFAEKQWEAQQEQLREEFDYKQKSDEQKIAFEYLMTQIQNGETPTSEMYKKAGLTDAEGQALVAEANADGSPVITWRQAADAAAKAAGYTGRNDPKLKEDAKNGKVTDKDILALLGNG